MPKVPDGWVLVPTLENMTDEQAEAIAEAANCCGGIAHSIYQQLLGASPEPDTTDADTRVEDLKLVIETLRSYLPAWPKDKFCKGSVMIGTACGRCARCIEVIENY